MAERRPDPPRRLRFRDDDFNAPPLADDMLGEVVYALVQKRRRRQVKWPLRRASAVTVHRYPWLFRPWTRRWQIVEDLSTGDWRIERRPSRRDRAWRGV